MCVFFYFQSILKYQAFTHLCEYPLVHFLTPPLLLHLLVDALVLEGLSFFLIYVCQCASRVITIWGRIHY